MGGIAVVDVPCSKQCSTSTAASVLLRVHYSVPRIAAAINAVGRAPGVSLLDLWRSPGPLIRVFAAGLRGSAIVVEGRQTVSSLAEAANERRIAPRAEVSAGGAALLVPCPSVSSCPPRYGSIPTSSCAVPYARRRRRRRTSNDKPSGTVPHQR